MQNPATPAAGHKDNLFGVCAALGEDFGFNPIWLRLALGVGLLFAFEAVIAGYFVMGAIVLVSRLIVPTEKKIVAPAAPVVATGQDEAELEPLRKAA
ncbi:PspC domain-containing protein [Sphingomonas sp. SUN019]|uniref:PspC domain-containing protein n=1 Tax=Sphingomonas sp. SUN019 TaxID=2937788 RepID=UPI0021645E79|nr:PspC domain-containing protein [Sphingomonas sp. SUN019]UVO49070.1 PspC domain-containing protein [Sphingomonas sp. SUN019]